MEPTTNQEVVITIRQVHFENEPSHWEGELDVQGDRVCEATGPTYWGVLDVFCDYLTDEQAVIDHNWFKFDANNRTT